MSRLLIASFVIFSVCISYGDPALTNDMDRLFTQGPAARFDWGCQVADSQTGQILYSHHGDQALVPASNQKLVVTAAALLALGPDYRPVTRFYADGPIMEGTLFGNLVVAGYGAVGFSARHRADEDPAGAAAILEDQLSYFTFQLRQAGIERIRGRILTDCSDYTPTPVNVHYPSAGPLTFNENTLDIWVKNGKVITVPGYLLGFSLTKRTKGEDQRKQPGSDAIIINTRRDSDDFWRLETIEPSDYFAAQLDAALERRGIRLDRRHLPSGKRELIVEQPGLSIGELIGVMNTYSDNLRAELLYLHLTWKLAGEARYELGPQVFERIFADHGWPVPSCVAADGSGLSRENRISAADLVYLLNRLHAGEHKQLVIDSLASAGATGTLKKHLKVPALMGNLRAKTGTLNGVKSLSGYLTAADGRSLTFSFIANRVSDADLWWKTIETAALRLRQ